MQHSLVVKQYVWFPDGVVWNTQYFDAVVLDWIPTQVVVNPRLYHNVQQH